MSDNYRTETNFGDSYRNQQKRVMRLESRVAVTSASQILGPGAGPFAIQVNDWNEEETTFTGVYYSEPDATNAPDDTFWWIGETFGIQNEDGERWGFQRLTRFHVSGDAAGAGPVAWEEQRRRFFPQGDLIVFTDWEAV